MFSKRHGTDGIVVGGGPAGLAAAIASRPRTFSGLLETHGAAASIPAPGFHELLGLGWQVLTA